MIFNYGAYSAALKEKLQGLQDFIENCFGTLDIGNVAHFKQQINKQEFIKQIEQVYSSNVPESLKAYIEKQVSELKLKLKPDKLLIKQYFEELRNKEIGEETHNPAIQSAFLGLKGDIRTLIQIMNITRSQKITIKPVLSSKQELTEESKRTIISLCYQEMSKIIKMKSSIGATMADSGYLDIAGLVGKMSEAMKNI